MRVICIDDGWEDIPAILHVLKIIRQEPPKFGKTYTVTETLPCPCGCKGHVYTLAEYPDIVKPIGFDVMFFAPLSDIDENEIHKVNTVNNE